MQMADSWNKGVGCYIPFVLDIISHLLRGEIDQNDFSDPEFCSDLLNETISNDYTFRKAYDVDAVLIINCPNAPIEHPVGVSRKR